MNRTACDPVWEELGARLVVSWPEIEERVAAAVASASNRTREPVALGTVANLALAQVMHDARVLRHLVFEATVDGEVYQLKTVGRTPIWRSWVNLLEELVSCA